MRFFSLPALLLCCTLAASPDALAQGDRHVVINQVPLADAEVASLERQYGVQIQNGSYWYDARSGGWGFEGGPAVGVIPAGLALGGPLRADASGGNTGVFINGRELHAQDVAALYALTGYVEQGRYWVDAYGNAGPEGGPALVNLYELARAQQGGSSFYRSGVTGHGAGSSGGTSYVMGKDWSVIVGN